MNINWVFAAEYAPDATIDVELMKNIGPSWGSWKSWRSCKTDNVVCDTKKEVEVLLSKSFQDSCNFYIPKKIYQQLNEPPKVRAYAGNFDDPVTDIEDVIAMQLAAVDSDLILLCGFNFDLPKNKSKAKLHRLGLIRSTVNDRADVQWVAIDHDQTYVDNVFKSLPNLTCDTLENVLQSLSD